MAVTVVKDKDEESFEKYTKDLTTTGDSMIYVISVPTISTEDRIYTFHGIYNHSIAGNLISNSVTIKCEAIEDYFSVTYNVPASKEIPIVLGGSFNDVYIKEGDNYISINNKLTEIENTYTYKQYKFNTSGELTLYFKLKNKVVLSHMFNRLSDIIKVDAKNTLQIENDAFYNCTNLKNVCLYDGITSLGNSAFYNCSKLESINLPSSILRIKGKCFLSCSSLTSLIFPSKLTTIEYDTCLSCSKLSLVSIPSSVTHIEAGAFGHCDLSEYPVPTSVIYIDGLAFAANKKITSINISKNVKGLGFDFKGSCYEGSFHRLNTQMPGNLGITELELHKGSQYCYNPFAGCTSLTSITVDTNNEYYEIIGNTVYSKQSKNGQIEGHYYDDTWALIGIKSSILKPDTTVIENNCFESMLLDSSYTYMVFLNNKFNLSNLLRIGYRAFYECLGLFSNTNKKDLIINKTVKVIDILAFYACQLNNVSFEQGDEILYIGNQTFCNSFIENIVFNDNTPLRIVDSTAFNVCSFKSFILPESVKFIGVNICKSCNYLESISVNPNNTIYTDHYTGTSSQNVIINKNTYNYKNITYNPYEILFTLSTVRTDLDFYNYPIKVFTDYIFSSVFTLTGQPKDSVKMIASKTLETIDAYAFRYFINLSELKIFENLTTVPSTFPIFEFVPALEKIECLTIKCPFNKNSFRENKNSTNGTFKQGCLYVKSNAQNYETTIGSTLSSIGWTISKSL